ncbi:7006_t:CDS:2 [Scutellospora calospora]|uniref:7006_t:CDS:1 n=1 Tax=Scutellospora calospora TaxID=85575 RepID=A0ACA9M5J7_9GLOM|nr:7006_t:CDS:2 [Scutellospora calospora]
MSALGRKWAKLTLNDLRDLCQSCSLNTYGNKEELGERLSTLFSERNNVSPAPGYDNHDENDRVIELTENSEPALGDSGIMRCDSTRTLDISDVCSETELLSGDGPKLGVSVGNDSGFSHSSKGKGKTHDAIKNENPVLVKMFLAALNKIEKKIDHNFEALQDQHYKETEPCDQYEYDFLIKTGKWLDKAIALLPEQVSNEFYAIREDIESRAVMLHLANNKGWKLALQVVGSNDKMMQKYKDQIGAATQVWATPKTNLWRYKKRPNKKMKRKYISSSTSSSESEDKPIKYQRSKKRKGNVFSFRNKRAFKPQNSSDLATCYNCRGIGHISPNCPSPNAKRSPPKPKSKQDD